MKLSLGMPSGIDRNPRKLAEEPEDALEEEITSHEPSLELRGTPLAKRKQKKFYATNMDFDDMEEEPLTVRRPATAQMEEVSGVHEIQKRREPKIVPPKQANEMLARVREINRLKAESERLLQAIATANKEFHNATPPYTQDQFLDWNSAVFGSKEELEWIVAKIQKFPPGTHSFDTKPLAKGIHEAEDLLQELWPHERKAFGYDD